MIFSTRQAIACMLMVLGVAVSGHAQSTPSKEPTASLSGKVTFQGEGVKGVIVALRSGDYWSSRRVTNYRAVTNAKGEYRITNVPPGNYGVGPTATTFVVEGEANGERSLIVNGSETIENFDFSLIRGGVITGRVVDSDGQPVIEEEVYAFSPRDPGLGSFRPAAITDDRGIYRIFALRPGRYVVAAARDDAARSTGRPRPALYSRTYYPGVTDAAQAKVIEVSDGSEATNIDVTFSRALTTYTASGRIVSGETGQPIPDVYYGAIRYVGTTSSSRVGVRAATNSQGEFKLENLVAGQYAVEVESQVDREWRAEELRFEIVDQDLTGLVVRTIKGTSLSGVVVLDGTYDNAIQQQLRNVRLSVLVTERSQRSGPTEVPTVLRPDGSFRAGGLPAGNATFSLRGSSRFQVIRVERNGVIQAGGIDVKQGEDVNAVRIVVAYGDGSVRGIVDIGNGTIPPNGWLFVRVKRVNDTSPLSAAPPLDARHQFALENLLPGSYELIAGVFVQGSRTPLVQKKQEVVVAAGSTSNVTIKLDLNPPKP
jgi:protocatechuate 3,4-dioxygenase beta subunit